MALTLRELNVALEPWPSSPVVRQGYGAYRPASDFKDKPARLTARQAVFYRNLIRIAEVAGSPEIPVRFSVGDEPHFLDQGCIKIAEHSGFIEPLVDGPDGYVDTIRLAWGV